MRSRTGKQPEELRVEHKDKEVELSKSPTWKERFKRKRGRPRKRPEVERCPGGKEDENCPGERESDGKQDDDSKWSKRGREKTTRKRREACQGVELSKDGLLYRKLQGPGSFRRVQLIVPRILVEVVL